VRVGRRGLVLGDGVDERGLLGLGVREALREASRCAVSYAALALSSVACATGSSASIVCRSMYAWARASSVSARSSLTAVSAELAASFFACASARRSSRSSAEAGITLRPTSRATESSAAERDLRRVMCQTFV
jgi:hypothetical protein